MAIEALDIEIKTTADNAVESVNRLTRALGRLRENLAGISSALNSIRNFSKFTSGVGDSARKATKGFDFLKAKLDSVKRHIQTYATIVGNYDKISQTRPLTSEEQTKRNDAWERLKEELKKKQEIEQEIASQGKTAKAADFSSGIDGMADAIKKVQAALGSLDPNQAETLKNFGRGLSAMSRGLAGFAEAANSIDDNVLAHVLTVIHLLIEEIERLSPEQLTAFAAALKGFSSAAAQFASRQFGKRDNPIKQFVDSLKLKDMFKGLKMVGRMALYRAIRSGIRMIAQSVKEGVKNLAEWDRATGQMNSSGAISTLSAYGQRFLELKNAVGAAAMPLMQTLLPVVQTITGWFISAANAVNQLIRALQGFSTFIKAGTAEGYDYADSMNSAAGGASKLKNTILGFDELNVMNDNSGGGGGGGSSSWGGLSAEDLFGEVGIGRGWLDFATSLKLTIKDVFGDWSEVSNERFVEKLFVGAGAFLGGAIGFMVGGVGGALIGLTIGAVLGIAIDALIFDHDGSISGTEAALTMMGFAAMLMGGVVGGMVGGFPGVVIGASVGFVFTLVSVAVKKATEARFIDQFYATDVGKELKALQDTIEQSAKVRAEVELRIADRAQTVADLEYVETKAGKILDQIVALNKKEILTPTQVKKMRDLIGQLNAMGLGGLMSHYDEATGHINLTEEAIRKVIQAQIDQAEATAYMELYQEALKDSLVLERQLGDAVQAEARANTNVRNIKASIDAYENRRLILYAKQQEYLLELLDAGVNENEALRRANESYRDQLDIIEDRLSTLKAGYDEALKTQEAAVAEVDRLTEAWQDTNREVDYYRDHAYGEMDTEITITATVKPEMPKLPSMSAKLYFEPEFRKKTITVAVAQNNGVQQQIPLRFEAVRMAAEGGIIDAGQLFIANEAGPELVGTMGGRTAVANSDQIVAGITSGVMAAMAGTGAKLDRTNDLLAGIAEKDGTVVVSTSDIAAGMARMNRRAGATVMPVGA